MNIKDLPLSDGTVDWWAEPVKAIYREALAALGGNIDAMGFGPGHIAWADGNFDDHCVCFCLGECVTRRQEWIDRFGEEGLEISRRALERLLLVPEDVRDCDPHECDGDESAELDVATAVDVLNRFRHDGSQQWFVYWAQPGVADLNWPVGCADRDQKFSAFEAAAIAEKYLRENG